MEHVAAPLETATVRIKKQTMRAFGCLTIIS